MSMTISHKVNVIGILALVVGILIGFWFLTVGLYITLWAYDTNKEISVFIFLILGIVFGLIFLLGGLGILRRRQRSRVLLMVNFYLGCAATILFVFANIITGLQEMKYKSFEFLPWIGGTVFCLVLAALFGWQALFLNRPDVKELFKTE